MIIIFDLDYTLLDTKQFKIDLAKTLGISLELFNESYQQFVSDDQTRHRKTRYILDDHIDYLVRTGAIKEIDKNQVKNGVEKFLQGIDDYLFPKAEEVIKTLQGRGYRLVLATFGNPEWHKLKVGNLSIKKYFDKVIITDKDKGPLIDFLKGYSEEFVVVNDNAYETVLMQEVLGKCQVILISGPYSKNCEHNFPEYRLEDVLKLIK